MSTTKIVTDGYEIDSTPKVLPDGKFVARAIVTRRADRKAEEIWPEFEPFETEAEASSAAQLAAMAWVTHQPGTA